MKKGDVIVNASGIQAKVKWVVDDEAGIIYLATGDCEVISTAGWTVVEESVPVYQDSVEHKTDEELRESIEALRAQRIVRPASTRTRVKLVAPKLSEAERKIKATLAGMSADAKAELERKLGLVE